ncbi:hypothetical protein ACFQDN_23820 [Pseudomonas asuensis]|nr:hypothetical protein [Pseudomonas asuensis]
MDFFANLTAICTSQVLTPGRPIACLAVLGLVATGLAIHTELRRHRDE